MWESAGQLADAYKIGKAESGAAYNLLMEVPDKVVDRLSELVKRFDSISKKEQLS